MRELLAGEQFNQWTILSGVGKRLVGGKKKVDFNTRRNVRYGYRGQQLTLKEISDLTGVKYLVMFKRLKRGWTLEEAIATPIGGKK